MAQQKTIPVAPEDLMMPEYIKGVLGRRDDYVRQHGFAESQLRIRWWNEELATAGFKPNVSVDPNNVGAVELARGHLFTLAETLTEGDDEDYLNFLWHVLIWGSGTSARNNRTRIAAFVDPTLRGNRVQLLREATTVAREGSVVSVRNAYGKLIRSGGGEIPGFGPAFFTKFLYFAGQGDPAHPCLILDARVASRLYDAGWTSLPRGKSRGAWTYSANWYTDTYASYCELLARWGASAAASPDEIERALFEGPRTTWSALGSDAVDV